MSDLKKPSPEATKKLLRLALSFVLIVAFYIVLFKLELRAVIDALYIVFSVLFVIFFYLSAAMAKTLPEKEDLNPKWDEKRREKFAERLKKNKKRSQKMIYVLVPLMAVIAFDLIYRVFFAS